MTTSRRPLLLHLVHERIGSVGGIQKFDLRALTNLAKLAEERGHDMEVLALNGVAPGVELPGNVRLSSASGSRTTLLRMLLQRHFTRHVVSVWVAHLRLQKAVWPARFVFFRSRYLLFVHGIEAWGAHTSRIFRFASSILMNSFVDDVISVSRFTATRMRTSFALRWPRLHLLPNAQDVRTNILATPCAESDASGDHPVAITVARMDRHDMQKGIPNSLRAIALLRDEFPRLKHRIVGDGELRLLHEQLAHELRLGTHVEFLGRVSDADLAALYASADVFLLPSTKEGFGIVFLEAWCYGLPIVCGNADASAEVVEHGIDGFAVDPHDPHAIADALRKLFCNALLRREFVRRGRQKLVQKYSATSFAEGLRRVLDADRSPAVPLHSRTGSATEDPLPDQAPESQRSSFM